MRSKVTQPNVSTLFLLAALVLGLASAAGAQTPVPGFSKSFTPATIGPGSISTLRFDIVNNGLSVRELAFTDNLPAGMTVASPANASTTCIGGSVSAPEGGSLVDFSGGDLAGGASCFVRVDVNATATATNVSGDLTSTAGNSGSASATLTVATDRPGFSKSFSPAAVFFGDRSRLTFTIDNSANPASAIFLAFTDTMPTGMTVASPANLTKTCAGGTVTASPGSSVISYSFGGAPATVAANSTCTIAVDVIGSAVGVLGNTSGDFTSQPGPFGGPIRSSGKAGNTLTVTVEKISLTKSFTDDPAAPGGTVNLRFTLRNLDRRDSASNISFTDDLDAALAGLEAVGLPANPCGAGSSLSGTGFLTFSGGSLGIEASCTFDVTLAVPASATSGTYTNTTSAITADIAGDGVVGDPATDVLFVEPVPVLTKTFLGDPVGAGDTIELEFTITNSSSTSEATDITFEDVFVEEIQTASSIPAGGFCGPGSTATFIPLINSGTGSIPAKLVIAGASLDPGASCTFSVILDVYFAAQTNTYPNTTSEITATIDGETVTGNPASDSFDMVAAPALIKEFIDDPAAPGGTVTLEFTLTHDENAPGDATGITFTDDLATTLTGLTASGLPMTNVCGAGSEIDGTSLLTLTGGTLQPGESCTISVPLDVPATAVPGAYANTTSTIVASILGVSATGPPATDDLRIAGLTLTKEFTDDPVIAGGTVTLEFVLTNDSPDFDATDVLFVDDLDAVVDNMTATVLPGADPCGAGSSLIATSGNRVLVFEAALLPAGASCTFSVTLQVPAGTASDTYVNRTDLLSATVDGDLVSFDNASDDLVVSSDLLLLDKEFIDDPVSPGDLVTLRFSLTNLSAGEAIGDVAFTDDLDAVLSGLAATGTPFAACGGTVSGTGVISFSGGSLIASETCAFNVTLMVPPTAPLGTQATNVTSAVTGTAGGLAVAGDPAADDLRIDSLLFSKSFSGAADAGGTVELTFTIENLDEADSDPELNFFDDLDAVIPGLVAIDTPKLDLCGEGSSLVGTSVLLFDNGVVPPGGSCTFSVTLQVPAGTAAGDYDNVTSDLLQGSIASAAPATATLTVNEADVDGDDDGVLDGADVCAGTVIPEGVPTQGLRPNRYALVDDDFIFDTVVPNGGGPGDVFTTTDTAGCSCEQIIEAVGLGNGHRKHGCSVGAMRNWVNSVSKSARDLQFYRWILDRSGKVSVPKP